MIKRYKYEEEFIVCPKCDSDYYKVTIEPISKVECLGCLDNQLMTLTEIELLRKLSNSDRKNGIIRIEKVIMESIKMSQ